MTSPHGADPDPDETPGLDDGGSTPPGDTPPAEASTPEAGPRETHNPVKGWAAGPLILIALVCVLVIGFFVARLVVMH